MIGDNIKTARKNKGYTQEDFAQKLNVVRQTVSKWEKNLSVPDADIMIKISKIVDVPVNDLLDISPLQQNDIYELTLQLEKMNELTEIRIQNHKKMIERIKAALVIAIIVTILIAIYPKWNEIWYEFGENIYQLFNG